MQQKNLTQLEKLASAIAVWCFQVLRATSVLDASRYLPYAYATIVSAALARAVCLFVSLSLVLTFFASVVCRFWKQGCDGGQGKAEGLDFTDVRDQGSRTVVFCS